MTYVVCEKVIVPLVRGCIVDVSTFRRFEQHNPTVLTTRTKFALSSGTTNEPGPEPHFHDNYCNARNTLHNGCSKDGERGALRYWRIHYWVRPPNSHPFYRTNSSIFNQSRVCSDMNTMCEVRVGVTCPHAPSPPHSTPPLPSLHPSCISMWSTPELESPQDLWEKGRAHSVQWLRCEQSRST